MFGQPIKAAPDPFTPNPYAFAALGEPETSECAYVAKSLDSIDLHRMHIYTLQTGNGFQYVDEGPRNDRDPVVLLHGMLGALENWSSTIAALTAAGRRVIAPILPVYDLPDGETSVSGLKRYLERFVQFLDLDRPVLVGNSLGGHVALLYALQSDTKPRALVLTGASGIDEVVMGESTPRRFDKDFVRDRAAYTFYDPRHASEELVNSVMEIVADRDRVIRLIKMARSARDEKVEDALDDIRVPTLLIWGTDDRLTPLEIGRTFKDRMANARLEVISACGHAPMIEHPTRFNGLVIEFLSSLDNAANGNPRSQPEMSSSS